MNNYRNYGNYGNRRYAGSMDTCGCKKEEAKPGMDCGCKKPEVRPGMDCGCKKPEVKPGMDCGCKKPEVMGDMDCGCKKPEVMGGMDCGCKKPEVMGGMDCDCKKEDDCGCSVESMYREVKKHGIYCEEDMPGKALAMAYVPWQSWRKLYEVCEGFSKGTIFKELDLEFYGRRCN